MVGIRFYGLLIFKIFRGDNHPRTLLNGLAPAALAVADFASQGSAVRIFCAHFKIALLKVFKLSVSPWFFMQQYFFKMRKFLHLWEHCCCE